MKKLRFLLLCVLIPPTFSTVLANSNPPANDPPENTFAVTDIPRNTATLPPVLTFPAGNLSVNVDPGQCTAIVNYPLPIVSDDNCPLPASLPGCTLLGDFGGHRYFLSDNIITWAAANTAAMNAGGYLVSITSAAENNFLAAFDQNAWIGLSDQVTEGTFIWSSEESLSYSNWNPGEPNNAGNEDYVEIGGLAGVWNDVSVSEERRYIVEINCGLTPTLVAGLASGSSFPLGTTTVTWSVTDGEGYTTEASFTVTVTDHEGPVILCRDTTVNIPAGQCDATIILDIPATLDCNSVTISNDRSSTFFQAGTTLITWTAIDAIGNIATSRSKVIVHEPVAPVLLTCPGDITVYNAPGICGAIVNFPQPTFTDNCTGISQIDSVIVNYTGAVQQFVVPANVTSIRLSATGAVGGGSFEAPGGNGAYMSGDFSVTPGEILYILIGGKGLRGLRGSGSSGGGGTFISRNPLFTTDLLLAAGGGGGAHPEVIYGAVMSNANTGTNGFAGGNSGNYGAQPGGINGNGGNGMAAGGGAGWLTDGHSLNCNNEGISPRNGGNGANECGVIGGYGGGGGSRTSGGGGGGYSGGGGGDHSTPGGGGGSFNTGTNQLNITGIGNDHGKLKIDFMRPYPKIEQTSGIIPGQVYPKGSTINTWVITDASGNTVTCSNIVTVTDNEAPLIQCSADITVNVDAGQCTALVNYPVPVGTDNCFTTPVIPGFTSLGIFEGHNYYLSSIPLNWEDAKNAALATGGTLACINSAAENNFLEAALNSGQDPWIGGFQNHSNPNYAEPGGGWQWLDGSVFTGYTNWGSSEPNNSGQEDVIQLYNDGVWNDADGSLNTLYIIEKNNITLARVSGPASGTAFPIGTTPVTWSATDLSGNTSFCTFNVTVNGIPATPGNISGPTNVCPFINTPTQLTYSIPAVTNATGYQWTVPPTVSIVSGQGTNTLTVTIGSGFIANINKVIKVRATSSCGNSAEKSLYLLAQFPTTPAAIVASTSNICPSLGTSVPITYKIPRVVAAAEYIWTAQSGTTIITHPNGPGVNDTTISVIFDGAFTTSTITVQAVNDCGTSGVRSITVTRSNPSVPSLISGPTNACENMAPNGTPATYNVTAVPGNTYNWIVPPVVIGLTGQGTNTISFTFPSGFVIGTLGVTATNGCGSSAPRILAISKLNPATPGVIDVIQTQACPNRIYSYTIASMPANTMSVQWTVPSNAIGFTGQGTTSIIVSYPPDAVQGTVTATAINNCGTSAARSTLVKLPACPPPGFAKGTSSDKPNSPSDGINDLTITVTPNPTIHDFKMLARSPVRQKIEVRVFDLSGRLLNTMNMTAGETIQFGSTLKSGAYIVEVQQGDQRRTQRLVKL